MSRLPRVYGSMRLFAVLSLFLVLFGWARAARAERKVYLNGIDLADVDVAGHEFTGCDVRFDKHGNVHITVKGLKIGTTGENSAPTKPKDGRVGKKYFLVVKPVRSHGDRYRLSVYVNGKLARLVKGTPQMQVHDITHLVKTGDNAVRLVSARQVGGDERAVPTQDLEVVVGQGVIENGTVLIQVPHVQYRRKASDTGRYDKNYRFTSK